MDYFDFLYEFVGTIAAALVAVFIYDWWRTPRLKIADPPRLEGPRSVNQELFRLTITNTGRIAANKCKLKIQFEGYEYLPQKSGYYSSEMTNKEISDIYPGNPEIIEIGWWGRKPTEHFHFNFKMMVGSNEIPADKPVSGTIVLLSNNASVVKRDFTSRWDEKDSRYYFDLK